MRKILFLIMCACLTAGFAEAQPKARQQQKAQTTGNRNNMTVRAQISFPTEQRMDEDVVWRRDVYREIDLSDDANAPWPARVVTNHMGDFFRPIDYSILRNSSGHERFAEVLTSLD